MKRQGKIYPTFLAPSVVSQSRTVFNMFDKVVTVEAPARLIRQLIKKCDGTRELETVLDELKTEWDEESLRAFTSVLFDQGILHNSNMLQAPVWELVKNPARYPRPISTAEVEVLQHEARLRHQKTEAENEHLIDRSRLRSLLSRRKSVRAFSGESVSLDSILLMLWSTYGEISEGRRTTPSAGALYPLTIHVALFKAVDVYEPGVYEVHLPRPDAVGLSLVSHDINRFKRAFFNPLMLEKAHGVITVSGSLQLTGEKYGNRSLLYVPVEAGHAAQNTHLAACEEGVATVEIGGFADELLREALGLEEHFTPLTSIVFGVEGKPETPETISAEWVTPIAEGYRAPFAMVVTRLSIGSHETISFGRDPSPQMAYTKAVSEAREWAACGCLPDDLTRASYTELSGAVDPRAIYSLNPNQYRVQDLPLRPFDPHFSYEWVKGTNEFCGEEVCLLADCVYFPYDSKRPFMQASSSGVAAHPNRQQALESSTLELVERDAFMNAYLGGLTLPTVSNESLPDFIRTRVQHLQENGFTVWVKDFSLDLAPTLFVFVQNKELTFTACAACSHFDPVQALDHALMEVEASVLSRLQAGRSPAPEIRKVNKPADHGALYEQPKHFRKADFLILGGDHIALKDVGKNAAHTWEKLLDRFITKGWQLITVPMKLPKEYGGNQGLHIIRSIVPGMTPITFGYRQEPAGMSRIYELARIREGRHISYADLPRFPHPFA